MRAAEQGQYAGVELLVDLGRGADPLTQDLDCRSSPAGWAEHSGHSEVADCLRSR